MAFLIHSIANENVVPWEYFPCSDALIPGEVLVLKDGKMVSATNADILATKSLYLSMCEKAAGEEEIPAVRIRDDVMLEGSCFVSDNSELLEGKRGCITDVASLFEDAGAAEEIKRVFHLSHVLRLLSPEEIEADSNQAALFELVGVMPPESDDPEAAVLYPPKVLIRLIG